MKTACPTVKEIKITLQGVLFNFNKRNTLVVSLGKYIS